MAPHIHRARFSLSTCLLLITVAAMAITIYLLYAELAPLRAENRSLRQEVGAIVVEDPSRLHVVKLKSRDPLYNYRWRVYVPDGWQARLCYAIDDIPPHGLAALRGSVGLVSGEQTIEFRIRKADVGSGWNLDLMGPRATAGYGGGLAWLRRKRLPAGSEVVGKTISVSDGLHPTVLVRERYAEDDGPSPKLAPGLLIWIEKR